MHATQIKIKSELWHVQYVYYPGKKGYQNRRHGDPGEPREDPIVEILRLSSTEGGINVATMVSDELMSAITIKIIESH